MNELADLLNEYMSIDDKESLYARVLKSFITERELFLRRGLERQVDANTRDREYRARLRHFVRTAPLERLVGLYEQHRPWRDSGDVEGKQHDVPLVGLMPLTRILNDECA